jgi:hypothetical protein
MEYWKKQKEDSFAEKLSVIYKIIIAFDLYIRNTKEFVPVPTLHYSSTPILHAGSIKLSPTNSKPIRSI